LNKILKPAVCAVGFIIDLLGKLEVNPELPSRPSIPQGDPEELKGRRVDKYPNLSQDTCPLFSLRRNRYVRSNGV